MLCPCAGSAAIELFPYHFDHTLYFAMAKLAGVGMFPVHSTNGTNTFRSDDVRARATPPPPLPSVCGVLRVGRASWASAPVLRTLCVRVRMCVCVCVRVCVYVCRMLALCVLTYVHACVCVRRPCVSAVWIRRT